MFKKTTHTNPTLDAGRAESSVARDETLAFQRGMDEHRAMQKQSAKPSQTRRTTSSVARVQANRANAAKSTGPRTPAGKSRSAQNATKHGLLSESTSAAALNAAAISPDSLSATFSQFTRDLGPANTLQAQLVARLAHLHLRLQRAGEMEEALLTKAFDKAEDHSLDHPDYYPEPGAPNHTAHLLARTYDHVSKELNLLSFYEARLSRDFHRTLRQLKEAQRHPNGLPAEALAKVGTADANPQVHSPALPNPEACPPDTCPQNPTERTQPPSQLIDPATQPSTPKPEQTGVPLMAEPEPQNSTDALR